MSRYSVDDPYVDPASGVLKNRLGITGAATLEETEAALVATRSYELSRTPLKGAFDLAHLQAVHRYLFRDLYEWAGELRTIDIAKGGHHFGHYAHIASAATELLRKLAAERRLAGLAPAAFSQRAAFYLGEINALHPFREGNGRAQREFMSHLAHANGYYIAWENVKPADLLQASIDSFTGDIAKLTALIRDNLCALDRDPASLPRGRKRGPAPELRDPIRS
jgi:fido (protein-threonine AMPylation protein)